MTQRRRRRSKYRILRMFGVLLRGSFWVFIVVFALMLVFSVLRPPPGFYMMSERARLGGFEREWVPIEEISPTMLRAAVAAEDANFCTHHGVDWDAVLAVIEDGSTRGASTITQQVAKNVFLWHNRSYVRKALELPLAYGIDFIWSKRRILEVYLNVAEFDEGVFGIEAGARRYFDVSASELRPVQAARLASILPDPKGRSASNPGPFTIRKAEQVLRGAETIDRDGRAECFQ